MEKPLHCIGCTFRRPASAMCPAFTICHYMLDTGKSRGCPAVQCTCWQPSGSYRALLAQLGSNHHV